MNITVCEASIKLALLVQVLATRIIKWDHFLNHLEKWKWKKERCPMLESRVQRQFRLDWKSSPDAKIWLSLQRSWNVLVLRSGKWYLMTVFAGMGIFFPAGNFLKLQQQARWRQRLFRLYPRSKRNLRQQEARSSRDLCREPDFIIQ